MALAPPGRGVDRADPAERGERRLVGESGRVVARGDQERAGDLHAHTVDGQQRGRRRRDQLAEVLIQATDLGVQGGPAAGQALDSRDRVSSSYDGQCDPRGYYVFPHIESPWSLIIFATVCAFSLPANRSCIFGATALLKMSVQAVFTGSRTT
jgi:hypothetical protein